MAVLPETTQALNTLKATLFPAEPETLEAPDDRRLAELGHAALVAGDLTLAETNLVDALALNPGNVRALLDLGVLYRSTGREALARELDGAVLAPGHNGARLADVVSRQRARVAAAAPAPDAPPPQHAGRDAIDRFATLARLRDAELISGADYTARRTANLGALVSLTGAPPSPALARPAPAARDVIDRLRAIAAFRKSGGLSEAEAKAQHAAILDSLIPAVGGEPASDGAARTPPGGPASYAERLDRLLAENLISEAEHERERAALAALLALSPPTDLALSPPTENVAAARETAEPAPTVTVAPIDDHTMPEMAAAPQTAESPGTAMAARTAAAPETAVAREAPATPAAALEDWFAPDTSTAPSADAPPAPQGELGIHLASFRTPQRAWRGWEILREAHGDVLANLAPRVARLDLGKERGVFFQLGAVPVPDMTAARALCSELKRREIYCAPKLF